jgi:hypothetical protein
VEEGVVLRRGSLVLAPSEEKSIVVSKTPSVSIYTNSLAPTVGLEPTTTSWKDSQLKPSVIATVPHTFAVAITCHIFVFFISFHG